MVLVRLLQIGAKDLTVVLTQELISILNKVSDDLHRSCFSLKSGFEKVVITQR